MIPCFVRAHSQPFVNPARRRPCTNDGQFLIRRQRPGTSAARNVRLRTNWTTMRDGRLWPHVALRRYLIASLDRPAVGRCRTKCWPPPYTFDVPEYQGPGFIPCVARLDQQRRVAATCTLRHPFSRRCQRPLHRTLYKSMYVSNGASSCSPLSSRARSALQSTGANRASQPSP